MALYVGGTSVTGTQVLDATKLSGNLPAISGASLTGLSSGLSVADQWFLTTNTAVTGDITSNLARSNSSPFGAVGSAMTVSSGIFTFPSTGYYRITATWQGDAADNNDSYQGTIKSTTDNSSYSTRAIAYIPGQGTDLIAMTVSVILDITNTSNDKVKFDVQNVNSGQNVNLLGNSSQAQTCFNFLRLGDT